MRSIQSGFTIIELLTVVAIIGILAAIALPQFSAYRKRGFDVRAMSDLRNAATAEEAYFMDHEFYLSCRDQVCAALPGMRTLSKGVRLQMTASDSAFRGTASHPQGTGKAIVWDSDRGGLIE